MQYRALGRTGLMVSEVGIGGEHLEGKPYEQVRQVIDAALKHGINILDIFMSNPSIRGDLGKALQGRRDQMIIQGHIGAGWENGQYMRTRELSECKVFFENLMARLQTDYIDIGMLHFIDTDEQLRQVRENGIFAYVRELKRRGVVRAVGASSHDPATAIKLVEAGEIDVLMFSVNPAYDILPPGVAIEEMMDGATYRVQEAFTLAPERARLYRLCEAHGVGVTVMKGLGAGTLLKAETSPFGVPMTVNQLIHYALTRPAVASVLVGAKTVPEVEEAVGYEEADDAARDYSLALKNAPRFSMDGKCMYCNHCLPCAARIDIAQVSKYLDLAEAGDGTPGTVRAHYEGLEHKAGECLECGQCEPNCPFGVAIVERMRRAAALFGA